MGFYSVHACTHAIIIVCIYKNICVAVDRTNSACTAARLTRDPGTRRTALSMRFCATAPEAVAQICVTAPDRAAVRCVPGSRTERPCMHAESVRSTATHIFLYIHTIIIACVHACTL